MTRLDRHRSVAVFVSVSLVALSACTFKQIPSNRSVPAYEVFLDPPIALAPSPPPSPSPSAGDVTLPASEMLISAATLVGVSEDAIGVPKLLATSDPLSDGRVLVLEADQASVSDILRSLTNQIGISVSWTQDGVQGVSQVTSYSPVSGTPARLIDRVCADANLYCRYVESMKAVVVTAKAAFVVALPAKASERKKLLASLSKAGAETTKVEGRRVWLRLDRVSERRIVTAVREDHNRILDSRGLKPVVSVPAGAKVVRVSRLNADGDLVGRIIGPLPDVESMLAVGMALRKS